MSRAVAVASGGANPSRPGGVAAAAAAAEATGMNDIDEDDNTVDAITARIIVPPPTANNPLPVLSLAIRVDNREQLYQALFRPKNKHPSASASHAAHPQPQASRQVLVFSSSSFRTLMLRHVLEDPSNHHNAGGGGKAKGKASAGAARNAAVADDSQRFPLLPPSVVGTDVLGNDLVGSSSSSTDTEGGDDGWNSAVSAPRVDLVTYVLSAASLSLGGGGAGSSSTASLLRKLVEDVRRRQQQQMSSSKHLQFHVWVLPQPSAYLTKILTNALMLMLPTLGAPGTGTSQPISNSNNATIANAPPSTSSSASSSLCQLDWFPLETDVISMECESLLREAVVEQVPSRVIQTSARALLKLQDVVGNIPRIQAYGTLAEEVLRKFLNLQVDEFLAKSQHDASSMEDEHDDPMDANGNSNKESSSSVAAMIIMDRRVDYVTPLLTPLTYEGLLDETFGIDAGHLHVPAHVLQDDDDAAAATTNKDGNKNKDGSGDSGAKASDNNKDRLVALPLNSGDTLYAEVRDQHVEQFGTFLQNQARALKESHANFTSTTKKKDLAEIHQFVKQIPVFTQNLKSLTNHIQLAEKIKNATQQVSFREQWQLERSILEGESTTLDSIEELMAAQCNVWKLLRLLCLQSVCQGGIKSSRYDAIKRDVVQTYGYRYLLVLSNLERAGLLSRREGLWVDATVTGSPFYTVRNSLHLIHAEVDTIDPDDIAYVSSGYAPLSVRIIQTSIKGWTNGREDILKENLGGGGGGGGSGGSSGGVRFVDVLQRRSGTGGRGAPEDLATALKRKPPGSLGQWAEAVAGSGSSFRKPTLVVFYLGGVTYMELASLRFLSKRPAFPYHIVCVTSKIVNGTTMLRTLSL
jgi:vacuolar protein sorting-associated protein 33A